MLALLLAVQIQAGAAGKLAATYKQIAARPHQAGTPASRTQAELIAQLLRADGLDTELHSYWALLSYPRRLTLRLFRPAAKGAKPMGIPLPLNERSDPRDPDTANPELPTGYVAYTPTSTARGPIVYVGDGRPADYAALPEATVKGAVVLIRQGTASATEQVKEAQLRGALGVVLFSEPAATRAWPLGPGRAAQFVKRDLTSGATIPVVTVAYSVIAEILGPRRKLTEPATIPGELDLEVHMNDGPRPIFNVVASIAGSDPGAYVMIGTHHDAWGFGGVDPGESVAALLEVARTLGAMQKQGWKPRHGIQIAFWDAGEFGNLGAAEHAREFATDIHTKLAGYIAADSGAGPSDMEFPPADGAGHFAAFGAAHSIYDTLNYATKLYDPGWKSTRSLAESLKRAVLQMASEDAPVRAASAPAAIPADSPLRGEIDHAEARWKQAEEAFSAGVITRKKLESALTDLNDARDRYERLRQGSGQLTPAIAAEEVTKAEARLKDLQRARDIQKINEEAGLLARRDLDQANERVKEAELYLESAKTREQELTHEWELIRKVKEFEARGGRFDDSVMERLSFDYDKQFGRPLPVSAMGMTHTHELLNFDHTGRVDVALNPDSVEGRWLIAQLTLRDIPFLVFRGPVAGKATGAHIHLGLPSPRLHK